MNEVNRGVIVVKPKTPFVDWVHSTDDDGVVLTLDEVSRDCTAYLAPEFEDDDELREFLEQNYALLFEQELVGWNQDEEAWPANRDLLKIQKASPRVLPCTWLGTLKERAHGEIGPLYHYLLSRGATY